MITPAEVADDRAFGLVMGGWFVLFIASGLIVTALKRRLAPKVRRFIERMKSPEGVTFSTKRHVAIKLMYGRPR